MQVIVPKKKSKIVNSLSEIKLIAEKMQVALEHQDFFPQSKIEKVSFAIHHSQVDPEPFNFFVIRREAVNAKPNEIVIIANPEIVEKDKTTKRLVREGCLSFPFRQDRVVNRCMKIKVKYQVPNEKGELETREHDVYDMLACIFQHEIEHAHGKNIYQV